MEREKKMGILNELDWQRVLETAFGGIIAGVIVVLGALLIASMIAPAVLEQAQAQIDTQVEDLKIAAATEIKDQLNRMTVQCEETWKKDTIKIKLGEEELYCEVIVR